MSSDKDHKPIAALVNNVPALMQGLSELEKQTFVKAVLEITRTESSEFTVENLWHSESLAITYWVLVIQDVQHNLDLSLAQTLLTWRELSAGPFAKARVVRAGDREEFRFCTRSFQFTSTPTLFVSNKPDFSERIEVEANFLQRFVGEPAYFERFLHEIKTKLENNKPLEDISKELRNERIWDKVKIVTKNLPNLVSIKVSADAV